MDTRPNKIVCSLRLKAFEDGPYVALDDVLHLAMSVHMSAALSSLLRTQQECIENWDTLLAEDQLQPIIELTFER